MSKKGTYEARNRHRILLWKFLLCNPQNFCGNKEETHVCYYHQYRIIAWHISLSVMRDVKCWLINKSALTSTQSQTILGFLLSSKGRGREKNEQRGLYLLVWNIFSCWKMKFKYNILITFWFACLILSQNKELQKVVPLTQKFT